LDRIRATKTERKQLNCKRLSDVIPLNEKADEAKFPSAKVSSANLISHNKRENMRETFSLQKEIRSFSFYNKLQMKECI